jgi:equilibrative nucleoside transporter 1/2/3
MDRIRRLFDRKVSYEPIANGTRDSEDIERRQVIKDDFSWLEYCIFLLLGIAMLWAWYAL